MKRIISSSVMIFTVLAVVIGSTGAFFSDTETSAGNVFTAGSIDLKINHTKASYNGEPCGERCVEGETNLVVNGSFETPVLNNGSYAIYPDASQTSWVVESGPGLEIQRNAAGAPQEGFQHAELDSTGSSVISQTLTTVAGQKYRFSFWHSPRPNVPVGDNTIGYEVIVTSGPTTLITGTVGAAAAGGANTNWTQYVYEFTAQDTATKIVFRDLGSNNNTYGGYIDNVVVRTLDCTTTYTLTPGGYCELWESKDLAQEKFFDFRDVKPQDSGSNLISMTVSSNEAYMCLNVANKQEQENGLIDPEAAAGDGTPGLFEGELGQFLHVVGWRSDSNGNKIGTPLFGPTKAANLGAITYADSLTLPAVQPNVTQYIHLEWCMGDMTLNGNVVTCNGNVPQINQTQTDAFLADLQFYAVQTRNNQNFTCSGAFPTPEQPPVLEPFSSEESE